MRLEGSVSRVNAYGHPTWLNCQLRVGILVVDSWFLAVVD